MEYFVSPYSDYAAKFANSSNISAQTAEYESNINAILEQSKSAVDSVNGWKGLSANQTVKVSLSQLQQSIETLQNNVRSSLQPAIAAMDELNNLLIDMESNDKNLDRKKDDLNVEKAKQIPETITTSEKSYNSETKMTETKTKKVSNPEYAPWIARINEINDEINKLREILEKIKSNCDNNIAIIETLQGQIEDLSINLAVIENLKNEFDDEMIDFSSLTLEEREAMLQAIIDEYRKQYDEIKSKYLMLTCDEEKAEILTCVILTTDIYPLAEFDGFYFENGYFIDPMQLVEFIEDLEKKQVFEKIEKYLSGESWEESGMADLGAKKTEEGFWQVYKEHFMGWHQISSQEEYNYWLELDETNLKKVLKDAADYYKVIKVEKEEYEQNILKLAALSNSIRETENLKSILKYIDMMGNPDFELKSKDISPSFDIHDFYYEYVDSNNMMDLPLVYENLSEEERKVFNYIYNTSSNPTADAGEFLAGLADSVFRRIGEEKAQDFVRWVADNPDGNVFFDNVADFTNTFGKGTLHGFERFGDYLMNCIEPSKVKEPLYYEIAEIANLFTNDSETRQLLGETKANALASTYTVGLTVGEQATPALVRLVSPTASTILTTASNVGRSVESSYQSGQSYGASLGVGLVDGCIKYGVDFAAGKVPGLTDAVKNSDGLGILVDTFKGTLCGAAKQGSKSLFFGQEFDLKKLVSSSVEGATKSATGKLMNFAGGRYTGDNELAKVTFKNVSKQVASSLGKGASTAAEYTYDSINNSDEQFQLIEIPSAKAETLLDDEQTSPSSSKTFASEFMRGFNAEDAVGKTFVGFTNNINLGSGK